MPERAEEGMAGERVAEAGCETKVLEISGTGQKGAWDPPETDPALRTRVTSAQGGSAWTQMSHSMTGAPEEDASFEKGLSSRMTPLVVVKEEGVSKSGSASGWEKESLIWNTDDNRVYREMYWLRENRAVKEQKRGVRYVFSSGASWSGRTCMGKQPDARSGTIKGPAPFGSGFGIGLSKSQ